MKIRHFSLFLLGVALGALAGCARESPRHRSARLSAIFHLSYLRTSAPGFRQDTFTVAHAGTRIDYRAWFDGPHLVILHQDGRSGPDDWSRGRFYLIDGKLLACTTATAYPPDQKFRLIEADILFDPDGRPLAHHIRADGRSMHAREAQLQGLRSMYQTLAHSLEEDLLARRRARH